MDKVTLDGKVYERSAVVAKRFGYTADYMGQLSRAKKVDAQLIGRSWYVNSDSVRLYQEGLEDDTATPVDTTSADAETYSVPVHTVEKRPVAEKRDTPEIILRSDEITHIKRSSRANDTRKTSLNAAQENHTNADHMFRSYARWRHVAYKPDDGELLPKVQKVQKPKKENDAMPASTPVVHEPDVEIRSLHVHSDTDQFSILTGEMPEVQLRGRIDIVPLDEKDTPDYSTEHVVTRKKIADLNRSHTSIAHKPPQAPPRSSSSRAVSPAVSKENHDAKTPSSARWYAQPVFWFTGTVSLVLLSAFFLLAVQVQVVYDAVSQTTTTAWTLRHPMAVLESLLALF